MTLPQVTATGNVVADPELRFTQAGKAVASFRMACNKRYFDKDANEWKDGDTTFLGVDVWNGAETVAEHVKRGAKVTVVGDLTQREWEQDGQKRTAYSVRAATVAEVVREFTPKPSESSAPF